MNKFKSFFKFLLTAAVVFAIGTGIAKLLTKPQYEISGNAVLKAEQNSCSKYSQLDEDEKLAYATILDTIKKGETVCTVRLKQKGFNDSLNRAYNGVVYDHPELFWMQSAMYTLPQDGEADDYVTETISFLVYDYWKYKSSSQDYIDRLNTKVSEIIDKAKALPSEYDKALFVHDYLVKSTVYASEKLEQAKKTHHDAALEIIWSAYGCLIDGEAVCAGYAKAYQLIMNRLGIDCTYVSGDTPQGRHAWNCIRLDGAYYLTDVTWDDPTGFNYSFVRYDYFCLNDKTMGVNHTPDESWFEVPECDSTKYNYYMYNGYYMEQYNILKINQIISDQQDSGAATVKFGNKEAFDAACKDLMENKNYKSIDWLKDGFSYYKDEEMLLLRFTVE